MKVKLLIFIFFICKCAATYEDHHDLDFLKYDFSSSSTGRRRDNTAVGCAFEAGFLGGDCKQRGEVCSRVEERAKRIKRETCKTTTSAASICGNAGGGNPPGVCGEIKYEVTTWEKSSTETEPNSFPGKCTFIDHTWPFSNECICQYSDETVLAIIAWQNEALPADTCAGGAGACQQQRCPPKVKPDPHFRTFQEVYYDWHGACDVVLLSSAFMTIHIRTKVFEEENGRVWSGIIAVAIRVDGNYFEFQVQPTRVFFNGLNLEDDPVLAGSLALTYNYEELENPPRYRFNLDGTSQYVIIGINHETISVVVDGHEAYFSDAVGLMGTFSDTDNGMLSRDKSQRYDRDTANAFAEEWQVDPSKDPTLFINPGQGECTYGERRELSPQKRRALNELAEEACAAIEHEDLHRNCVFDVEVTGDVTWADSPDYVVSVPVVREEQCEPDGDDCVQLGGTCSWLCDATVNTCDTSLCKGKDGFKEMASIALADNIVNGCSCALPIGFVQPAESKTPCLFGMAIFCSIDVCGMPGLSAFCFDATCGFIGRLFGLCD